MFSVRSEKGEVAVSVPHNQQEKGKASLQAGTARKKKHLLNADA